MRNLFTQLLQQSYSNQTNDTLSRDYRMGVMSGLDAGLMLCATSNRGTTRFLRLAAMVTLLLTLACGNVWGDDRGFWDSGAGSVRFYRNGSSEYWANVNKNGVSDFSLGNIDSDGGLIWTDAWAKVWGGNNIFNSITLYWRVKGQDAGSGPSYSNYNLNWNKNLDGNNQYWEVTMQSQTCSTTGLAAGNYEVEFYWTGAGKDGKTYYLSNNGGNYHANFTLRRKITYHTDGKTSGDAPATEWFSGAATVRDNTGLLQKTGYVFAGWADSKSRADAGTIDHEPGTSSMSVTLTANLDLYPVWKPGSYFISLTGSSTNGVKNTTDFIASQSLTNTATEVNGVTFSKSYYKTANSQSSIKQQYQNPSYFIVYDTKSTTTKIRVYVKNTDSSSRTLYYYLAKEGSTSETDQSVSLSAGEKKVINIDASNSKGTRVILCNNKNDKIFITQIIAIESGTTLPLPGQTNYELAFPGRVASHFPDINGIEIRGEQSSLKWNYGDELRLQSGSGKYVKFTTTSATQLRVKTLSGKGFYVCTDPANPSTTGFLTSGSSAGTKDIYLDAANTYYIVGETSSNTKIDKISFAAHTACTAPTGLSAGTITYKGATFTVTDGTNANNYEFYVSTSSTAPTASTTPTYTSTSKTLAVDDLTKNTTYYAWVRTNGGYFHKSAWTALTGTTFKTLNAYDITYNCDGATYGCPEDGAGLALPSPLPSAPFKAGYNFDGWFTNSGKTVEAVAGASISENTTLYAKWTKVYASTKDFTTSKTQGTVPNQKTITTSYTSYTPFRVDNFFFGATNKLCFESGNADAQYNGWKFQYSGSTIKFYVENDCDVAVAMGANAGCSIKYTPIDGVETTENLSTTANTTTTKGVEAGTMVTLTTTSGSTVTLKSITITDRASCSAPAAPTISGTESYISGGTITLTASCASGADASTTYTWYKGADWATASAASPVQAAATGSAGYTFTKTAAVGDAGTYWCEASNGSGCESHNSVGYAIDMPLGAHTLTWNLNVNTSESSIGTASKASTTSYISNTTGMTDLANYGSLSISSSAKADLTSKIQAPTSYTEGKYMYVTFTVPSGYQFTPSSVSVKVQPVSAAGDVKLVLSDAGGHSINKTQSNCSSGSITTVTMTNGSSIVFYGTVTLKIYCYGSSTGTYRLGSPITIDGTVAAISGYTVTYEDGGATSGSVPVDSNSPYEEDDEVTVLGNTGSLAKNGYTFAGWSDGSTDYEAGDKFDMPAEDVTLTAQWTPNTYDITYNLNGASWASSAGVAEYTVGTGATLPLAGAMTNTGYTFGGWYDNSGLTGSAVTEITTSDYGNKTFWAKWTENAYTITYNANGGSGSTTATNGHYVTVADNGFTAPDGKSFVEWNTLSTGLGVNYNEGDEIELTADMTLYAIWAKSVGTINWSVTKIDSKLYRGGGGYTITAEINDASWDATAADSSKLELTASDGVVLRNIAKSINASDKAQITANFDITTDVNANATKITFTLNVPENNGYAPLNDDHNENLDNCTGGKVEVRFLSSEKNDAGDNFADMSTSSNTTQLVGDGFAKLIAIGSAGLKDADNKIGYRDDGRLNVVFKLTSTTTLDIYFNANSTSKSFALYSFSSAKTLSEITTSDYSSKTIVSSGVTAAGATFSSKSHTASTGSASVSSGVVSIGSTKGGLKATYSSLSAGYYVFDAASSSNESYVYGFDANAGGGGGSAVTPTLTWDDGDLDIASDGVAKETGDADFTFTASTTSNTLGAITYASSNTSVVTVNATSGKVHIVGGGSATITATIAESGCYDEATASYSITVTDNCDDEAGTISTEDLGCDGIRLTVTGHTGEGAGATYQWYKDGASISGATNATYTATDAGEYYVIVTNTGDGHCSMASTNTVVIKASETATATKIVDEWYVKNGRRTPDIALVQTENATGFIVKSGSTPIWNSDGSVTTGFAGCGFYLGEDGIIYLKGQKDDETEPSGLSAGDETLKFTASACGGNSSELSITVHKQAETSYKTVAFVVEGTKGGEWNVVTSGQADGSALYEYLDSVGTAASARKFALTECNIYKTNDEKTLRQYYSQFDAILITDNPNTRTVPKGVSGDDAYKTKGYVNAIGALIDIRPVLTMEAYVSALSNWKSKGINGNPSSPNPRQYAMKLDCKNHAIFTGIDPNSSNVEKENIDDVEYWTVTMVDNSKSPYSGVADDSETDDKPALQGFEASDVSELMLLGEISDGALYAGVERQEEPAARLMLLGLNNKALPSALTPEGKKIIENALSYLIETDMERVDDCSNYFTGATSTNWNTATNWSKGIVPNSPYVKARILSPCVVSSGTYKVASIDIATSGKSINKAGTINGSLTINAGAALVVGGRVRSAEAPYFNMGDLMPTTVNDLVINTSSSNQAALVFNNDDGDTEATVNLYSLGRKESGAYQFQYLAVPMNYIDVNPAFAGSGIYTYVWHEASGWERRGYYTGLEAFEGVGITTKSTSASSYTLQGALTSTTEKDISLTKESNGQNIVGNSWLAPIDIASLCTALTGDDNIVDKTVYIYCTGNDKADDNEDVDYGTTETAGQWLAIPISAAGWSAWDGLKVIPAMQAFCIKANTETTLTLNYKDHVRSTASAQLNQPLRAPKREAEAEGIDLMRIRVADSKTHTDLYLFEGEQFSEAFDNGWEAKYMSGDGRSAKLYAETTIGQLAVAAQPEYEGTVLGFAPGQETEYIFTFSGPDKEYYLNDLRLKKSTLISEGESYLFTFEEGDTNRFYISKTRIDAPAIATGTENTADGAKARKVIVNDKLYIIRNGRVYSAEGIIVK